MKKLLFIITIGFCSATAFAQNVDLRRKIDVTGIAEQEVTPDIINVSISLQEYLDGRKKVTIDQLEGQLEAAVKDAGIPKDDFTISNVSAWNNTWQKKKNPDFLASKQYMLRLHDLNKYNQVLSAVDPKGVQETNIASYDYSKMTELKHDLKIKALQAAKDKATYLLTSINEKLGRPIEIDDSENTSFPSYQPRFANTLMAKEAPVSDSDINFKTIKLSFQVHAIFEIAP